MSVGEGEDNLSSMPDNFLERRDLEQYFFTKDNIETFINMFFTLFGDEESIAENVCLVCAPSLAKHMHEHYGIVVTALDIDRRFEDVLPGFRYFDLREPYEIEDKNFSLILIDPPFFSVSHDELARACEVIARGRCKETRLLISFPKKDERSLRKSFASFGIDRTTFELSYATVKPTRWDNYVLYGNSDIPFAKRIKFKK